MPQKSQIKINYDREIEKIDEAILACKKDFEDLLYKRHEMVARKFGVDVMELIDYISKNKNVPKEAVDIIATIAMKKRKHMK